MFPSHDHGGLRYTSNSGVNTYPNYNTDTSIVYGKISSIKLTNANTSSEVAIAGSLGTTTFPTSGIFYLNLNDNDQPIWNPSLMYILPTPTQTLVTPQANISTQYASGLTGVFYGLNVFDVRICVGRPFKFTLSGSTVPTQPIPDMYMPTLQLSATCVGIINIYNINNTNTSIVYPETDGINRS